MVELQYVGPAEILERVQGEPEGTAVEALADLVTWLKANPDSGFGWRLADIRRRSRRSTRCRASSLGTCGVRRNSQRPSGGRIPV